MNKCNLPDGKINMLLGENRSTGDGWSADLTDSDTKNPFEKTSSSSAGQIFNRR